MSEPSQVTSLTAAIASKTLGTPRQPGGFDPAAIRTEQGAAAIAGIARDPSEYLHFPWPALDSVVGAIAPGWVWFVGGFSGNGKTTFLASMLNELYEQGKRVYYLGLESPGHELLTLWASMRAGVHPGDALTGNLREAEGIALAAEIHALSTKDAAWRVFISPVEELTVARLNAAAVEAVTMKADVLVIDHIDHIDDSQGPSLYQASVSVTKAVLKLAQKTGLRVIAATQFNNEGLKGDPLGTYRPPQPHHVYMGGHKRQIASGMLGLYRPMRLAGVTDDEIKRVRAGSMEAWKVLEPNTMGVVVMKHRAFGARERATCLLRVEQGRVCQLDEKDRTKTGYEAMRRF